MTEKEQIIIDFIKSGKDKKRYLCEFENIIPVAHNKRYQWQIRGAVLGRLVKKELIKKHIEGKKMNRQTIYYVNLSRL